MGAVDQARTPRPTPAQREVLRVLAEGGYIRTFFHPLAYALYDCGDRHAKWIAKKTMGCLIDARWVSLNYTLTDAGRETLKQR